MKMLSNTIPTTAIRRWLVACMLLVAAMVLIGGLTRLTESGLSIVKWKLVTGTLPPLTSEAWQAEFQDYQTTPQFQKVNHGFNLADFQRIYWLEYIHRLLGRLVGMVIFLPFFYFLFTRKLNRLMLARGTCMALLVAAQGTVGWIMVASGLQNEPRVEPLKLALHLSLAFALFLLMLWTYWQVKNSSPLAGEARWGGKLCGTASEILLPPLPNPPRKGEGMVARLLFMLIFLQVVFGALVAGLRAGLSYNTYPLMDGQFIPDGLWTLTPWWRNHLESILTVQFQHRMLAIGVVIGSLTFAQHYWKSAPAPTRQAIKWLLRALALQFSLGVATLLSGVNLAMASAHQLGALALLSTALYLVYTTRSRA